MADIARVLIGFPSAESSSSNEWLRVRLEDATGPQNFWYLIEGNYPGALVVGAKEFAEGGLVSDIRLTALGVNITLDGLTFVNSASSGTAKRVVLSGATQGKWLVEQR